MILQHRDVAHYQLSTPIGILRIADLTANVRHSGSQTCSSHYLNQGRDYIFTTFNISQWSIIV